MSNDTYDLIVLGGGNAIALAISAGKAGLRTAVIEKGPLGGTCPNVGCIPSKLLIGYADRANAVREAGKFHVSATLGDIDGAALLRETFAATRKTDGGLENALPDNVTLLRGHGSFVDDHTVEVDGRRVTGKTVVIGTGTRPRRPTDEFVKDLPYMTSNDVFSLDKIPESMVIVGGGFIACEMAHFFSGVGCRVTVLVRGDHLLVPEDEDVRRVFQDAFSSRLDVRFQTSIEKVTHDGAGFQVMTGDGQGATSMIEAEALLYAIGRVPNADGIGIENTSIARDERGFVVADDSLATNVEGVYAMGDVKGRHFFTHAAAWEASYLADRILSGGSDPIDYGPMPHAVFSHPEIAGVGATEQELKAAGTEYVKASVPFTSAAKGRAVKEEHGLCKFLLAPDGRILGCHIVGHEAATLLHEVIPVMKWKNHITSLTGIIHIHPSLSEVVRNAARKAAAAL